MRVCTNEKRPVPKWYGACARLCDHCAGLCSVSTTAHGGFDGGTIVGQPDHDSGRRRRTRCIGLRPGTELAENRVQLLALRLLCVPDRVDVEVHVRDSLLG